MANQNHDLIFELLFESLSSYKFLKDYKANLWTFPVCLWVCFFDIWYTIQNLLTAPPPPPPPLRKFDEISEMLTLKRAKTAFSSVNWRVCRKFEGFVGNLGGFAPPPQEKVNFRHWCLYIQHNIRGTYIYTSCFYCGKCLFISYLYKGPLGRIAWYISCCTSNNVKMYSNRVHSFHAWSMKIWSGNFSKVFLLSFCPCLWKYVAVKDNAFFWRTEALPMPVS
jgi:hypothetical protein